MNLAICIYNAFLYTLGGVFVAYFRSKSRSDRAFWQGRWGRYPRGLPSGAGPHVWLHAASVGEVAGALPILSAVHARMPDIALYLTVSTPQGFRFARAKAPDWVSVLPFPLDLKPALNRALQHLRPDLYVALEGEFWPNLLWMLKTRGIPSILLNGRLSPRSAKFYRFARPLFQPCFQQFRWLAMHSHQDLKNVLSIGVPAERAIVLGTSKYDGLASRADPQRAQKWRELLQLPFEAIVIIGGSLRRSECYKILQAYAALREDHPELIGIFAPRHLERIRSMSDWLRSRKIPFQLMTHLEKGLQERTAPVILVDRIGALFELYALGNLIFCGGTLEPIGGHNILEPAAWEKPVFYGPFLKKVLYEHYLLQTHDAGFLVKDINDLQRQWSYWLKHPGELSQRGRKAAEALKELTGVAAKQADLIVSILSEKFKARRVAILNPHQAPIS